MKRIKDFVESWLYYPILKKTYAGKYVQMSRFRYALWHSKVGKLKEE